MPKKLLSVGSELPGGEVEQVDFFSKRSLLDADIVVFSPSLSYSAYNATDYQGKPCLADTCSFKAREALLHWRRELSEAVRAGKLVVVFLEAPVEVYAATGHVSFSGTGKNARKTRNVGLISSYGALPVAWTVVAASGVDMRLLPEAKLLSSYWEAFSKHSSYEVFIQGDVSTPVAQTRTGARLVASMTSSERGTLVALPSLNIDDSWLEDRQDEDGDFATYWTDKGIEIGHRLVGELVAISNSLTSNSGTSPAPAWVSDNEFRMPEEAIIERQISEISADIDRLVGERQNLEDQYAASGALRNLLFEQGNRLEHAVLAALTLFGFEATSYQDADSEFDAVFTCAEGRFLGEIEGRDNRSISVEKFSQLERNLNEDFSREETTEYAKGVLFGNGHRLTAVQTRPAEFTDKCLTAAKRVSVALVRTSSMFAPARYLKENKDESYAKSCREAIFNASGIEVVFPTPPDA